MTSKNCIVHGNMSMKLDPGDTLGIGRGRYETEISEIMCKYVGDGMTVLDIGANIGYFTLLLSRLVGKNGTVHAIEAAPHNVELLKYNIKQNNLDNVIVHGCAVGAAAGSIDLHLSECNNGMHRIYQSVVTGATIVKVPLMAVDEISGLKKADFIKIDIEGAEVGAFRGMKNLLENSPNLKIVAEFSPSSIREAGEDATELVSLLLQHKFQLKSIRRKSRWLDAFRPRLISLDVNEILKQLPAFNQVVDTMINETRTNPELKSSRNDLIADLKKRLRKQSISIELGQNILCTRNS